MSEKTYPRRDDLADVSLDPNSSYAKMLELVGVAEHVLDVGCASGYFARLLSGRGYAVAGVDLNPDAVRLAAEFCAPALVADLDRDALDALFPAERFDVVVFGDVLEHLRDPWRTLDQARKILTPGGHVVVSIPNVAHGAIRLGLLAGKFNYAEAGILDDTHLRFFTRRTLMELFVRAGFEVECSERTILPLFEKSSLVPELVEDDFEVTTVAQLRQDPDCETLQFVVRARALDDAAKLTQLIREFVKATAELDDLHESRRGGELQLREEVAALDAARRAAHEDLVKATGHIEQLTREASQSEAELRRIRRREAQVELSLHAVATSFAHSLHELRIQTGLLRRELEEARAAHELLLGRVSDLQQLAKNGERLQEASEVFSVANAAVQVQLARAEAERGALTAQLARKPLWYRALRRVRRLLAGVAGGAPSESPPQSGNS